MINRKSLKLVTGLFLFTNLSCSKKSDSTAAPATNIATAVVANLNTISAGYTPSSLSSSSALTIKTDPCAGTSDFGVCQSNLIREYIHLGKSMVDVMSAITGAIGQNLGQIADGSTGTSTNSQVSWTKTDINNWSFLSRNLALQTDAYISVNSGVYVLKIDNSVSDSNPHDAQIEATVHFTDSNNWTVDVFFHNGVCDATTDPGAPSKAEIKISKANSLWTGKAMLYMPHWHSPGTTASCNGTDTIAMYTDFVGNDTSTKAALYLIPSSTSSLAAISGFGLNSFCTNFSAACTAGGMTGAAVASYTNNWCTTGPNTTPIWGDSCASNTSVSGAGFSTASDWIVPTALTIKTVSLPSSL